MPAVRPVTDPGAPAYTRVTVLAPRTRVDVALPADVPLGELVPMVLELVGEPGPRPVAWRLTGATGGPLHPAATLDELGVLDGELLRIGPDTIPPPPPVFDDPVDALAASAGRTGRRAGPDPRAAVALVLGCLAAAVVATLPAGPWAAGAAVLTGAAAVGAVARAASLARRPDDADDAAPAGRSGHGGSGRRGDAGDGPWPGDRDGHPLPDEQGPWEPDPGGPRRRTRHDPEAAGAAALLAVPLAAGAGAAAFPGPAQLLLAVAAAGVAAASGQAVLRSVRPVLVGVVVAAVPVGLAAVVALRLDVAPGPLAAGIGALALLAGPLLPRAALRLAGLPGPVVPADAGELTDADDGPDLLPPAELAARSELARGHLAGLVGGCAVLAAASVVPVAGVGGWVGPALGAVTVAVLGLRARGFADAAPARALGVCSVLAGVALTASVALAASPPGRLIVAVLAVAGAGITVAAGRGGTPMSPVARRAVDILEGVLIASAVPLAIAAMGLFAQVRGL
ncbi:type VII secretion integral membrane protein EccD [Pseudonocardia saturnea]